MTQNRHERFHDQTTEGGCALKTHGIAACGMTRWLKPGKLSEPSPEYHTLLFVLAGNGWLDQPKPRQKLAPKTLCLFPIRQAHAYQMKPPGHVLWMRFERESSWSELMPDGALVSPSVFIDEIKSLVEEFLKEGTRPTDPRLLEGYTRLITLFLRRELVNLGSMAELDRIQSLENLWMEVSRNPAQAWSIERLASATYYSRSHFHATVQRLYNCGAMEIVSSLRMKYAMAMLQNRTVKIATAAESVGYDSPYSFSRAFKRIVGVTPESYRQHILAK